MQNDPLWNMRHAIAGVAAAVFLSVPIAAMLGSALGDWVGQSYGWRAGLYSGLLLYVVVGAGVLFGFFAARQDSTPPVCENEFFDRRRRSSWPGRNRSGSCSPESS